MDGFTEISAAVGGVLLVLYFVFPHFIIWLADENSKKKKEEDED